MSAESTNLHLMVLIEEAAGASVLMEAIERSIIPVLIHAEGFWVELHYCYKAAEITDRCCKAIDGFITEGVHHARGKRLEALKYMLRGIGDRYRKLQADYMYSDPVVEHCCAG